MPSSVCPCGIDDGAVGVAVLATRIFDNVRFSLDRTPMILETVLPADAVTPLFAGGTGAAASHTRLTVTPHFEGHTADLTGDLLLSGTLTYLAAGSRRQTACTLVMPISVNMVTPADALWPYDITVHYSFFADRLTVAPDGTVTCLADGVVILYITACVPLSLPDAGPIRYENAQDKAIPVPNPYAGTVFYPAVSETT